MRLIRKMYLLLKEKPDMTNAELRAALGWSDVMIRNYKHRLKSRGYIEYGDGEPLRILRDYTDDADVAPSVKQEIYEEMVSIYMEDFRAQENFTKRIAVGREIRLLLEAL